MLRTKSSNKKYSRADVEAALQNLIKKGLVVTRTDADGRIRYIDAQEAPFLDAMDALSSEVKPLQTLPVIKINPLE